MNSDICNSKLVSHLSSDQRRIVDSTYAHAMELLDHTHRFKFFTLHGKEHTKSLFRIADILIDGGIIPHKDECFWLSLALCIHDLGMVVPLENWQEKKIFDGYPIISDPAVLEEYIRDTHHNLVELYFKQNTGFLTALGLSPPHLSHVLEISRCHRKIDLDSKSGFIKYLGSLMRLIDELDISSKRAPIQTLMNTWREMDTTSLWHWFKHNIVEEWQVGHNVHYTNIDCKKGIEFELIVHPTTAESIPYWLHQIRRPLRRVLVDDGCARIIADQYGVSIDIKTSHIRSTRILLSEEFCNVETNALSSGRKVILVIDDEYRKLTDLFLPLMDTFHVVFSPNASDALEKLAAHKADLVIVDMQVGAGSLWDENETQDFKATGKKIIEEVRKLYPNTKVGALTGTMHAIGDLDRSFLSFFIRKPVDPDILEKKVRNVLS